MENITIDMLATSLVVLLSGLSGLFIPLVGGISALMRYMPGAMLTVASNISGPIFALANGMGSCCVCIPIPLAFGLFALRRRANASALEGQLSQAGTDI